MLGLGLNITRSGDIGLPMSDGFTGVGDGSTGDKAAFNTWFSSNSDLVLGHKKQYVVSDRLDAIEKDFTLNLNGSTIICPEGFIDSWVSTVYSDGNYFDVTEGGTTFTVPGGVSIAAGDVLELRSDDTFQTVGTYKNGQYVKVTDVSLGVATVSPAYHSSFGVDQITVYDALNQSITNGVIDMTGATEHATGQALVGIDLRGDAPTLNQVRILGNQYVGRGCYLQGMAPQIVSSAAQGITNTIGIKDGGGTVIEAQRQGYGFEVVGDAPVVSKSRGYNCKHPVSSASRNTVSRLVTYSDCAFYSDVGTQNTQVDIGGSVEPLYQGVDCHAGVMKTRVERCTTNMVNMHYDCRAVRNEIVDCTLVHRGSNIKYNGNLLINGRENPADIYIENLTVSEGESAGATVDAYITGIQPWYSDMAHTGVEVDGLTVSGDFGLFNMPEATTTSTTNSIDMLDFGSVSGSLREGIVIDGDAAAVFGAIGNITIGSDGLTVEDNIIDLSYIESLGSYTITGTINGSADYASILDISAAGPELLDEPSFDATGNWNLGNGGGTSAASIGSGQLTIAGDGSNTGYAHQSFATEIGVEYDVSIDVDSSTPFLSVGNSSFGSELVNDYTVDPGVTGYTFTATQTTHYTAMRKQSSGAAVVNSLSIKKAY